MQYTPDVIINKPLQYLHHTLTYGGGFFLIVGGIHFAVGNNGILQIIIAGALFWLASKIKYRWDKKAEAAIYE